MRSSMIRWGVGLLLCTAVAAGGDRVVLRGGYSLTGDVLKQDKNIVIVDIGCAVLRLPRSKVVRIEADGVAVPRQLSRPATRPAADGGNAAWQLYRTAEFAPATIETCARRAEEGVVMIQCPGGQGSGFIINPEGYCVTNYHVIARETRIKVTIFRKTDKGFQRRLYKKVRIIAINPSFDLALLKIEDGDKPFKFVHLGAMKTLAAGRAVFAIGNPLGLTRTVSQGIISSRNRNVDGKLYIQTTADINPGNSGGPLFNLNGEVIGVTSMGYLYLGGLNFAIPVDVVKRFIANRDAFAYDEDNPNTGHRYLQPAGRQDKTPPPKGKLPAVADLDPGDAPEPDAETRPETRPATRDRDCNDS